jgi:hypothetical protein
MVPQHAARASLQAPQKQQQQTASSRYWYSLDLAQKVILDELVSANSSTDAL